MSVNHETASKPEAAVSTATTIMIETKTRKPERLFRKPARFIADAYQFKYISGWLG